MTIAKRIDLKRASLSQDRLRELAAKVGSVEALFSRRSLKFRSMGIGNERFKDKDLVDLMASEYALIKRPVIEIDNGAAAGFSVKAYRNLLNLPWHSDNQAIS